jgi:ElaB/YqjD/DUF883 family membrane-anchored ribosome-binding protein
MADDAVDTIAAQGTAALQAIIDDAEANTMTRERAALAAAIAARAEANAEIRRLQKLIEDGESDVVRRARAGIATVQKALEAAKTVVAPGPRGRFG